MSDLAFEQEVSRIIKIEIPHWKNNNGNGFTSLLLDLIQKADNHNKHKLSKIYPAEVEAFRRWENRS